MLKRIKNYILRHLVFKHFKPEMSSGYKCKQNKKYLTHTRISNTTVIMGENNLYIEDNVYIGHHNVIDASNALEIGEGCQITNFVSILTHSSHVAIRLYGKHYIEHNGEHIGYIKGKTIIGAYSFIGPHSVVMPGVTLGRGSIVSAYSYVKPGIYPEFAILSGNPAIVVGDTRTIDAEYLDKSPQLRKYYHEWATQRADNTEQMTDGGG
jgi:acetyltransferase-like isoleucine patch superfamily enzyme